MPSAQAVIDSLVALREDFKMDRAVVDQIDVDAMHMS